MRKILLITVFLIFSVALAVSNLTASQKSPMTKEEESKTFHQSRQGSNADFRMKSFEIHKNMKNNSVFKNLKFRNVGPLAVGGRITDVEACSEKPYTLFVAYASGGLWKTTNSGTTWKPLFDEEASIIMGDIAVQWPEAKTIWVGTGENNSSRSSYSGTGIYKSDNGGKTWQRMGLEETHRTGRIIIDPQNPDVVYVAAAGSLYSNNENRGVYKTTDGGKSWENILYVNDRTGCIDLVIDPSDNNTLYAAMWERDRRAWNFLDSGHGSGVYKTTDGGKRWTPVNNGLPETLARGRIALDISGSNPEVLYAFIDNQSLRPKDEPDPYADDVALMMNDLAKMTKDKFLKLTDEKIDRFLNTYGFHKTYTAKNIKKMLRDDEITVSNIVHYVNDANRGLFESRIKGAELYRSDDGGKNWYKTHKGRLERLYYTYGYYFGEVRIDPADENIVYLLGVPIIKSTDGGKNFSGVIRNNVHVDIHAMWIDPQYPERIVLGNDGGLNLSYDGAKTWQKVNRVPTTQFYTVTYDMAKPYNIYGGTQDNGTVMGTSNFRPGRSTPWRRLLGGDGGYIQVNPKDNSTAYLEWQFGNVFRTDLKTGALKPIKPNHKLKEEPLRYNWQAPILMSERNPDIIYFGTNRLYRSLDKGDNWDPISPDLTVNTKPQGDVPYSTITTVSESPFRFGLLYIGTDDGRVWITRGGGDKWTEISNRLPEKRWVTRVIASKWDEATVYVTLNGYRDDEWNAWVYKSTDYGKTWRTIKNNLPDEPVNVIREDSENRNILYLGTDLGCYISLDGGASWHILMGDMPNVPVHDMAVHPRDRDLIVGTHGRSIFVINLENIQKLNMKVMGKPIHLFELKPVTYSRVWEQKPLWRDFPRPELELQYYLKEAGEIKILVKNEKGNTLRELVGTSSEGMNSAVWDYTLSSKQVRKAEKGLDKSKRKYTNKEINSKVKYLAVKSGKYTIQIIQGVNRAETILEIKPGKKIVRSGNGRRPKGP